MTGERKFGRREFLVVAGSAAAGSSLMGEDSQPEFSIELAVTEDLADLSENETGNREYALEMMDEFIGRSIRPFVSDSMTVSVEYSDLEPSVSGEAEEALRDWNSVSSQEKCCSLLVTGDVYDGLVGIAETPDNPLESSVALVGEGYDFLGLESGEWRQDVLFLDYETLEREINYTPWKTVVAGLHEIGHALSLEHSDGEVYDLEKGVQASLMSSSYAGEFMEDIRYSDDVYWSTQFSESARESLHQRDF